MSAPVVVVFDYGIGNVHSVLRALDAAGAAAELSADPERALAADGFVVPGVGAFAAVMSALTAAGGDRIIGRRLAGGRPVLGICVGMQVLFDAGVEGGEEIAGLGEWPGRVTRLAAPVLPHVGWNTVGAPDGSVLFDGIGAQRFYFVHSYAAKQWALPPDPRRPPAVATYSHYGERFLAAVENGPLSATQFHPEKSGTAGVRLLRNWVRSL